MIKISYSVTLVRLRKSKNISQKAVAKALLVSRPTYLSWEYGSGDLPLSKLFLLSNYYELSVHVIIQMIFEESKINLRQEDLDFAILKNDLYRIKQVLEKYL
ncbi:helix-turn-helix transcriptional regulator [Mucilaginibacter psychrotolerans]|uniref:XRE family transcriptional regulator n=1 Tax=Mucilaginibacter psychrotolerans TaxID=1524096 RepID=A0A4Y8S8L1_9SPHI|nr:XRE family transcriptional regulator [Mucilaginibacter psychrotolerans]